jgi:formylglycine-generating enzyme required for sulfatase activity
MQMLEKGHNNVKLSEEDRHRLITWIDLNVPHRGSWRPPVWRGQPQDKRRLELAKLYASVDTDPEQEFARIVAASAKRPAVTPNKPNPQAPYTGPRPKLTVKPQPAGKTTSISLSANSKLNFVRIPAGKFVMGSATGALDERPLNAVTIDKPFAICTSEISNAVYALFDPKHDSGYIDRPGKNLGGPGDPTNRAQQPVVRVTWRQAMAFCEWMSKKTGKKVTLPTEAQWEYACRAGTDTPMWYGSVRDPFDGIANFADKALSGKVNPMPRSRLNDGVKYAADVVYGKPNPWGLVDMHGNVSEWTRSAYRPYPYTETDGRSNPTAKGRKVARGGSWRDRPARATSSYRLAYEAHQPVVNVGFRVVIED